jgi:TolB protein
MSVGGGLIGPGRPVGAAFPGANGRIAYSRSSPNSDGEIFTIRPDGLGRRRLTRNSSGDFAPAWSPNGRLIAFTCKGPVGDQSAKRRGAICVMDADGGNRRVVFDRSTGDHSPSWSPNGRRLVFERYVRQRDGSGLQSEIFSTRLDGTRLIRLTRRDAFDAAPAWAPDGKHIAFVSDSAGFQRVWLMRPDGSGKRELTTYGGSEDMPEWSPNSRRIVFSRFIQSGERPGWKVFSVSRRGGALRALTDNPGGLDLAPSWSPNGRRIVYARGDDLFRMNTSGGNQTRLTGNADTSNFNETDANWKAV